MKRVYFCEALNLFHRRFGKVPLEAGLPAIDADNKQGIYLYARSGEHLKAFIRKERLFRWLFVWVLPLTAIVLTATTIAIMLNPTAFLLWQFIVVAGIGSVVLITLGTLFRKYKNFVAGKVVWLSQPAKSALV